MACQQHENAAVVVVVLDYAQSKYTAQRDKTMQKK